MERREAVVRERRDQVGIGIEELPQAVDPAERGRVEDVQLDPFRQRLGSGAVA